MEIIDVMVEFSDYCKTCKHKDLGDFKEPCNECLENATNTQSKKPIKYEEKETKKKESK